MRPLLSLEAQLAYGTEVPNVRKAHLYLLTGIQANTHAIPGGKCRGSKNAEKLEFVASNGDNRNCQQPTLAVQETNRGPHFRHSWGYRAGFFACRWRQRIGSDNIGQKS